ncbi:MAG: metallophosphoesterase, partial [Rhodobacteraceae bacterium]|nr:metallophosphoesterase [Paracoccaceae bacterium]
MIRLKVVYGWGRFLRETGVGVHELKAINSERSVANNAGKTSSGRLLPDRPGKAPGGAVVHVRVMETNDLHMNILPYDYFADRPSDTRGLARTATLIAQARAEVANALLFDAGDFLQGSPMGDYFAHERGAAPHPMIAAMNAVGYDAVTLGNHEFSYGLEPLLRA